MLKPDEKQQKLLENFFKEETKWQAEHVGYMLMACILIGISIIFLLIPYQKWEWSLAEDGKILIMMYAMEEMGILYYMQKYNNYSETGKVRRVNELMKYTPVSYGQLCIFRLRKLKKLCLWLTGITLLCQIVFPLAFYHTLMAENIILSVLTQFVIPMALNTGMMALGR